MTTNELWKPVQGYKYYEVSNLGRIKNTKLNLLKAQRLTKTGYLIVDLKEDGKKRTRYVHRLVAQAFIPNDENLPQVNHKDENKKNNCVENLEWCTAAYNNAYGTHIERVRLTQGRARGKSVVKLDPITRERLAFYESVSAAARDVGVSKQAIDWGLASVKHTAAGFAWEVV